MITEVAPAKVNMALNIVGKRSDGYHEMEMINHSIGLKDILTFTLDETLTLTCSDPGVPLGENNLILRAARALKQATECTQGARIHLEKSIPMEAGLGGGSADAAAALRGLNRLWQLGLSLKELQDIGVSIGADIPYCLVMGTALVTGKGEQLMPLPALPAYPMVVIKPSVAVATPIAFALTDDWPDLFHPPVKRGAAVLMKEDPIKALPYLGNSFESPVFSKWPEIGQIKKQLMACVPFYSVMSGSGSTIVGYFEDAVQAERAYEILRDQLTKGSEKHQVYLTAVEVERGENETGTIK